MKRALMVLFTVMLVILIGSTVWAYNEPTTNDPSDNSQAKVAPTDSPSTHVNNTVVNRKYYRTTNVRRYYTTVNDQRIGQGIEALRKSMFSGNIPKDLDYLLDSAANKGWVQKRVDGSFVWVVKPTDTQLMELVGLAINGLRKEIRDDRQILAKHENQLENHESRLQVVEGKLSTLPSPVAPVATPQPPVATTVQTATPTGPAGWIATIGGWLINWTGQGISYILAIICGIAIIALAIWALLMIIRRIWDAMFDRNQQQVGFARGSFPFVGAPNDY